jgi:hypothetical protein
MIKLVFSRNEHDTNDQFLYSNVCETFEKNFKIFCVRLSEIYDVNMDQHEYLLIHIRDDTWKNNNSGCKKIDSDGHCYISINFKNGAAPLEVFFHELCHVFQQISGMMEYIKDTSCTIWNGKTYDGSKIPHAKRLWEIDAILNTHKEHKLIFINKA